MEQKPETSSRKKFVVWGLGILSAVTAFKYITPAKKKKETVKMLTQDGKLVEVDKELLAPGKKITDEQLKSWVNKKSIYQCNNKSSI
ncbi:MAG TPA: hypothetical protein VK483_03695 [Chitinophagaceae bacterium]|nr:hypothetical protein [Chitinophagaceae bacterium]